MKTQKYLPLIGLTFLLANCSPSREEKDDAVYNNPAAFISSSAAVENKKDTTRKFIRTAELKFKVNSVIESTYDIEEITNREGGFVTLTNLSTAINNGNTFTISADSSLEVKHYTVSNTMTLRVPNSRLDTTLKQISKNIDFLDYRIIKAQDVALELLSNSMIQKRNAKHGERLANAINTRGKKLNETTVAEEFLSTKKEQEDNAKISNFSLRDQIDYSTVNLTIYQRQSLKKELIANNRNTYAYEPNLFYKLFEALKSGWKMLEVLVVGLIRIWPVLLILFACYILFKKYLNKNTK